MYCYLVTTSFELNCSPSRLEQKLAALQKAEDDKLEQEKRRNEEDDAKKERERKRKEDEERAKGEAAGRELLTKWRNDLNDVNAWMKKSEPKLRREPDDLHLARLKKEQKQVWVGIHRQEGTEG